MRRGHLLDRGPDSFRRGLVDHVARAGDTWEAAVRDLHVQPGRLILPIDKLVVSTRAQLGAPMFLFLRMRRHPCKGGLASGEGRGD